jgi:hypothetical protein
MADQKISARTAATTLVGTEIIPVVQSGVDAQTTAQAISDLSVRKVKVSVSSAEILALFTTPKTLVAAPGAGKMILPLRVLVYGHFGTVAYTGNTTLQIGNSTLFSTNLTAALGFSADQLATYTLITNAGTSTPAASINTALQLTTLSGNPTAGDSTVDIHVTYIIVTI